MEATEMARPLIKKAPSHSLQASLLTRLAATVDGRLVPKAPACEPGVLVLRAAVSIASTTIERTAGVPHESEGDHTVS
jgi:hypothetical protein